MNNLPRENIIRELDGIRAIAVIQVVCFHAGLYFWEEFTALLSGGYMGVQLFFILSSFLLSRQFIQAGPAAFSNSFLKRYAIKRFLRIYPLFFFSSVLLLWVFHRFSEYSPKILAGYFLFWRDITINKVIWSLFVEVRYYLLIPFLAAGLLLIKNTRKANQLLSVSLATGLCLVYAFRWYMYSTASEPGGFTFSTALSNADTLLLGVGAACWFEKSKAHQMNFKSATVLLGSFVTAIILIMISNFYGGPFHSFKAVWMFPLYNLCWTGVLMIVLNTENYWWNRLLSARWMLFISTISYSIYIWHLPIRNIMHEVAGWFAKSPSAAFYTYRFLLTWACTIMVSTFSYRLIEKPFLKDYTLHGNGFRTISSKSDH